jgi:nitrite reductase/ring-hydroxylating ferredoxin subunit
MSLADLKAGHMRCAEVTGRSVLLCNTGNGVCAVSSVCTHAAARLDEGKLRGHRLTCLLHGASFDVRSGAVIGGPAQLPLQSFPTRIAEGYVEVAID